MTTPQPYEDVLILVDKNDRILGYEEKSLCHEGGGILHRAFSIFLFNEHHQLLLQKRSEQKPLWPLYWSNSVCSHPRKGENYEEATQRRLQEELGFETPLRFLFQFHYQAAFRDAGSEHELCSVYIGSVHGHTVNAHPDEIAEWKYLDIEDVQDDVSKHPENYTPWFKIEWARIQQEYLAEIRSG